MASGDPSTMERLNLGDLYSMEDLVHMKDCEAILHFRKGEPTLKSSQLVYVIIITEPGISLNMTGSLNGFGSGIFLI